MKTPSISIDQTKIKNFFLAHGEKIGFVLFVGAALYFAYKSLSIETFDRTPSELAQITQQAKNNMANSVWREDLAGVEVFDFAEEAEKINIPIAAPEGWQPFDPPVFDLKAKRSEPRFFTVEDIEVSTGFGALQVAKAGGPERPANDDEQRDVAAAQRAPGNTRGYRWAIVKALVPMAKQEAAYDAVFVNAVHREPNQDQPEYIGYIVERAEVRSDTAEADLQWTRIAAGRDGTHYSYPDEVERGGEQLVERRFVLEELLFPLPPLVGREWGSEVTHSQVPLAAGDENVSDEPAEAADDDEPMLGDDNPFGENAGNPRRDRKKPKREPGKKDPDVRLFRLVDLSVDPGKRYRYRVRLALRNPNRGIKAQFLERPEDAQGEFRLTDWSEPSSIVTAPRDNNLLIGPAIAASGRNESKLKVMFEQFVEDTGAIARYEGDVMRGQLANVTFEDVPVDFPGANVTTVEESLTFTPDALIVDFVGGDSLPQQRRVKRPAEALIFAADGELEVRSEQADREAYQSALEAITEEETGPSSNVEDDDDFRRRRSRGFDD